MYDTDDSSGSVVAVGIILACIVALVLLGFGGYWIDRTFFYPQQRANTVANPDRSIANRQFFHDQLSTILTADQNIQAQLQAEGTAHCSTAHADQTICPQLETDMIGLQQIRSKDIGDYNSASDNPDKARDRDACLPRHIDSTEPVQSQITRLEQVSTNCPAPTNEYYP